MTGSKRLITVLVCVVVVLSLYYVWLRWQVAASPQIEGLDATDTNPNRIAVNTLKPAIGGSVTSTAATVASNIGITQTASTLPSPSVDSSIVPVGPSVPSQPSITLTPLAPGTSVAATLDNNQPLSPEAIAAAAIAATAGACYPKNGEGWSTPGGPMGTQLNSPCCQAPDFQILDKTIATCSNMTPAGSIGSSTASATTSCLSECCTSCSIDRGKYDPSWFQMCLCGCTMCCNNAGDPHFAKHGTCSNYVRPSTAAVKHSDYIGPYTPLNWRGFINAYK